MVNNTSVDGLHGDELLGADYSRLIIHRRLRSMETFW